ncbi:CHAT domain-containing protein [Baaleninema simplex]|uniref:CHAT domain-containing protein n=1 Tax=Baaleninema simplex TaxID=2862350 RepID=UPI00034AD450|nr:CHAT domain-containing protein [Baaleninema simplex]
MKNHVRAWRKLWKTRLISALLFLLGVWGFTSLSQISAASVPALIPAPRVLHVADANERHSQRLDPVALEADARRLYEAGQFRAAEQNFQAAAEAFGLEGDRLSQAGSATYRALALYELGRHRAAIEVLETALQELAGLPVSNGRTAIEAQAHLALGRLQLSRGQTQAALDSWQQAADRYVALEDELGELGALTNQAIALQGLGLYRRSQALLETVTARLDAYPDARLKITALTDLGVALQVVGDLHESRTVLERALAIAQNTPELSQNSIVLQALGDTTRALGDLEAALAFYRQAAEASSQATVIVTARLAQARTAIDLKAFSEAERLLSDVESRLTTLPDSRDAVYAVVNFVETRLRLDDRQPENAPALAELLATALERSRDLGDRRAQAYVLGQLGHLYESQQQWQVALDLTEDALQTAAPLNAPDVTAQWQAQLGRLYRQQGDIENAIAAYTQAVSELQRLSRDLVAINPEVRLSFRDSVEPVYRELVSLLLADRPTQAQLQQARETIEALQLAELENFFRESCLEASPTQLDRVDARAAAIYPIILPDRLEVILSLPGRPLQNYRAEVDRATLERTLQRVRQSLSLSFPRNERLVLYRQLYDWLVRPAETALQNADIATLVFVLDGPLRNLPMSVLYDGDRYLVEQYGLVLSQGLQLLEPRPLDNSQLQAVIAGLSEGRQGFAPLPEVESEIARIASEIPSEIQLNQQFTTEATRAALARASNPVLHLATHGQFSSEADDTFIVTWDGKLRVSELGSILQRRDETRSGALELLVLSACQTARGDDRAVLGLAGLAIESGARATVATLWSVRDRSTANLMVEFYRQLARPGINKAEALRQAQLSLLARPEYDHPFFWAPFVLVGNWL